MTRGCLYFRVSSFRLVDLHDIARGLGVAGGTLREERTGRGDGVWLDLAVRLLAYLDECDLESNEGWNPLGPFIKDMAARQPQLQAEDVQQVVAYLATPTEVRYLKDEATGPRIAAIKDTALVERGARLRPRAGSWAVYRRAGAPDERRPLLRWGWDAAGGTPNNPAMNAASRPERL